MLQRIPVCIEDSRPTQTCQAHTQRPSPSLESVWGLGRGVALLIVAALFWPAWCVGGIEQAAHKDLNSADRTSFAGLRFVSDCRLVDSICMMPPDSQGHRILIRAAWWPLWFIR
jgi:hypothetical protein